MTSARISRVWGIILLTITIFSLSLPAYAQYSGGTGEPNDPYQIATAADLIALGETPDDYDKHFILTADIDLDPNLPGRKVFDKAVIAPDTDPCDVSSWTHESVFTGPSFTGVFDGNGHTISHLTITGGDYLGLIGAGGVIKDLGVVDANIVGSGSHIGALVGVGWTVDSCYSTGVVSGAQYVGGLVGSGGVRAYCYSTATVSGTSFVGGLVGYFCGDMTHCYSTGAVSGDSRIGGLVGSNEESSVTDSYSTGNVSGVGYVGGLVGENVWTAVTRCYSTSVVSGQSSVGGLVGENIGTIEDCYAEGSVTGGSAVGGLAGRNGVLWTGDMSPSSLGYIINCYSASEVSGTDFVGGLLGEHVRGEVTGCFWDIQTSGQATSDGGTGKTTEEMQLAATFIGWGGCGHEGIWTIDDGRDYPRLRWENEPGATIELTLSDVLSGEGTEINPYLIYTAQDIAAIDGFPCEWDKHFRLMFLSGTGTQDSPYLISTAEQLILIGMLQHELDKHFLLTADIDMDSNLPGRKVFNKALIAPAESPSLAEGTPFTGVFDGNGHAISNLTIKGDSYLGLFGRLESGQVRNLGVVDVNIVGSGSYIGGLMGSTWGGTVTKCYSTGVVSGEYDVGGLVGSFDGTITQCYSTVAASGQGVVGGLVGHNWGTVSECYSTGGVELVGGGGAIRSYSADGGSAGHIYSGNRTRINVTTTEMMDPYMLGLNGFANDPNWVLDAGRDYPRLAWEGKPGDIIPEPIIDWLEGQGTPDNPYRIDTADQLILLTRASILWDKHFVLGANIDLDPNLPGRQVFTQAPIPVFAGVFDGKGHTISHLTIDGHDYLGLFGRLNQPAEVRNLGVAGVNINGSGDCVGGLVGQSYGVAQCHSSGSVRGRFYIGGLAGRNYGNVTQCYSTVAVSGHSSVGGLVGYNGWYSTITRCYSGGAVIGMDWTTGGLVGRNDKGTVTASFWDTQTSGQSWSDGGTGKTTLEMEMTSTFTDAGWDFVGETANGTDDIWRILEGQEYPRLWWEAEGN